MIMSQLIESHLNSDFIGDQCAPQDQNFSALNSLIGQNEELSLKLRFQIRKNLQFESDNLELNKKNRSLSEKIILLEEQILILRQKESVLFEKISVNESALQEQEQLKNVIEKQNSEIERHVRYQEKIRVQIKPYIQKLKTIATQAHVETQDLKESLEKKESHLSKLKEQIIAIRSEVSRLENDHENQIRELKMHLEKEKQAFAHNLEEVKLLNLELQKKAALVDVAHFKQNESENQFILFKAGTEKLIEEKRTENTKLIAELSRLLPEHQNFMELTGNLQTQLESVKANLSQSQGHNQFLEKQIQILRQQWNDKTNECEKLKLQLQSLESLNQDLTLRLNRARKGQPTL